jgi:osmoprotectant transport system ATP-binding protein
MPLVEFRNVTYAIGAQRVLRDVSVTIDKGDTLVLLGRSGSGKSTALKLTNGMLLPMSGEVLVEGRSTKAWDAVQLRRSIGYVIQEVGLFPHFTVADNIALVPRLLRWREPDIQRRVDYLLEMIGMSPDQFRSRFPHQLSGGQRQRVGVARALAADPPLLLLDEPFGALDPVTRWELQGQFIDLRATLNKTSVFVTHDIREALRVGSRIAVLSAGGIECIATPDTFHDATTPDARAFLATL